MKRFLTLALVGAVMLERQRRLCERLRVRPSPAATLLFRS